MNKRFALWLINLILLTALIAGFSHIQQQPTVTAKLIKGKAVITNDTLICGCPDAEKTCYCAVIENQ